MNFLSGNTSKVLKKKLRQLVTIHIFCKYCIGNNLKLKNIKIPKVNTKGKS